MKLKDKLKILQKEADIIFVCDVGENPIMTK